MKLIAVLLNETQPFPSATRLIAASLSQSLFLSVCLCVCEKKRHIEHLCVSDSSEVAR